MAAFRWLPWTKGEAVYDALPGLLAHRAAEQHGQRAPHPAARIGAGQIGAGDQRVDGEYEVGFLSKLPRFEVAGGRLVRLGNRKQQFAGYLRFQQVERLASGWLARRPLGLDRMNVGGRHRQTSAQLGKLNFV